MATDAVIQFKYSDNTHLVAIYKRYDAFPKDVIDSLKNYLRSTQNIAWDFIVADIISQFVNDSLNRKGIKMLFGMPLEDDNSFIFLWEIYPNQEFINIRIPLEESISVNIWQGNKSKLIYSGPISDFIE